MSSVSLTPRATVVRIQALRRRIVQLRQDMETVIECIKDKDEDAHHTLTEIHDSKLWDVMMAFDKAEKLVRNSRSKEE
jgi:hypothetical protein